MWGIAFFLLLSQQPPLPQPLQQPMPHDQPVKGITFVNPVGVSPSAITTIDGGPVVGNMLNVHYFPGLKDFDSGLYAYAHEQFTYVINRAEYLSANPRQAEYMSTVHYLRGMVYMYHADGVGRHSLAKTDFEASIKWNSNNYLAYLELSRVYSGLGLKDPALAVLQMMKKLTLEDEIAHQVDADLAKLTPPSPPAVPAAKADTAKTDPLKPAVVAAADSPPATVKTAPADIPLPLPTGKIAINSLVWADVYLEGKQVGSTPLTLDLGEGEYTLEFRHEDLRQSVTHTVKANETVTSTVSFDMTIDINAKPWAEVMVDGGSGSLGQTPLAGVRVPFGASLLFRNPDFAEKRYKIQSTDRSIGIEFP